MDRLTTKVSVPGGVDRADAKGEGTNSTQPEPALARELRRAQEEETFSFHMPGHKGGRGAPALARRLIGDAAFCADVSETGGFDYLHAPTGGLAEAQRGAAALFGAERTWFLVNGATVGNIAAVCSVVADGEKILMARSSHRSVYAGTVVSGAVPVYLSPVRNIELDGLFGVDLDEARLALRDHPDIRAIHVTSPNYYGFTTPTRALADLAHAHGIPLIVDEAHGSHFVFHDAFPATALACGADIVVQSPHKTLGSLTQSSLLHLQGSLVRSDRLETALTMLQSSSPSALLTLSLDLACAEMAGTGTQQWDRALALAGQARHRLDALPGIRVYGPEVVGKGIDGIDPIKVVVDVHALGLTGFAAATWLRQEHLLNPEFADLRRMVCSITTADDERTIDALVAACAALACEQRGIAPTAPSSSAWPVVVPPMPMTPREANRCRTVAVPLGDAAGWVAAEMVMPYPPGVPLFVPGETITLEALGALAQLSAAGCRLVGPSDPTASTLRCVIDKSETTNG